MLGRISTQTRALVRDVKTTLLAAEKSSSAIVRLMQEQSPNSPLYRYCLRAYKQYNLIQYHGLYDYIRGINTRVKGAEVKLFITKKQKLLLQEQHGLTTTQIRALTPQQAQDILGSTRIKSRDYWDGWWEVVEGEEVRALYKKESEAQEFIDLSCSGSSYHLRQRGNASSSQANSETDQSANTISDAIQQKSKQEIIAADSSAVTIVKS